MGHLTVVHWSRVSVRDGHAGADMSDSCRLMRICGHVRCVLAEKSDGAMKKSQITPKIAFLAVQNSSIGDLVTDSLTQ